MEVSKSCCFFITVKYIFAWIKHCRGQACQHIFSKDI